MSRGFYTLEMILVLSVVLIIVAMAFPSPPGPIPVYIVSAPAEKPKPPTLEEKMAAAGITCPNCPDVPDTVRRVRKTTLTDGKTLVVVTPTREYMEFLGLEKCGSPSEEEIYTETIRGSRCGRLFQLEEARRWQESIINPIYGRGPLDERQMNFLAYSTWFTERNLASFEYDYFRTKKERYLREHRNS